MNSFNSHGANLAVDLVEEAEPSLACRLAARQRSAACIAVVLDSVAGTCSSWLGSLTDSSPGHSGSPCHRASSHCSGSDEAGEVDVGIAGDVNFAGAKGYTVIDYDDSR